MWKLKRQTLRRSQEASDLHQPLLCPCKILKPWLFYQRPSDFGFWLQHLSFAHQMNPSTGLISVKFNGVPTFQVHITRYLKSCTLLTPYRWYVTDVLKVSCYSSICLVPKTNVFSRKNVTQQDGSRVPFLINKSWYWCIFCRIKGFFFRCLYWCQSFVIVTH